MGPGELPGLAHLAKCVMQCLVDGGWSWILVRHPALAGRGGGQPGQDAGDVFFGEAYLLAAVVPEHGLDGFGKAPFVDGAVGPQVGQLPGGRALRVPGVGEASCGQLVC